MTDHPAVLNGFLTANGPVIHVQLTRVRGSSPRDSGTEMFVTAQGFVGTIGGGQLEFAALEKARQMLADGTLKQALDVPLGPEIGQCCGGRVALSLARMGPSDKRAAMQRATAAASARPHVYILGAGHVGRALALQFQHLPVRCILVDSRREELTLCTAEVDTRLSVLPEHDIATAPASSAFIVLTHDHGLDFLLSCAALARGDAAYVGMIGSATKRATFRSFARRQEPAVALDKLTCPIGAAGSDDKRPSVIAAFVVAEVMAVLTHEDFETQDAGAASQIDVTGAGNPKGLTA